MLKSEDSKEIRPAEELSAELAAKGVTQDREIVIYCAVGIRAGFLYSVLKSLGYPRVANYAGSFLEWAALSDLPVVEPENDVRD